MLTKNENIKILVLILLAFTFSFVARLYWIVDNNNIEHYKFNNEYILTTNDAFYWAEGAKDLIIGDENLISERSPIHSAMANLAYLVYKITPISMESLFVYMPIFFSSLIVIPLILLGKKLNNLSVGFMAALIASIANSYYNRTMAGYFDTDFLNIVFPMFMIWSLYSAIQTKENKYIVFTAIEIILYRYWYPQSYALEFAFFSIIVLIAFIEFLKTKEYKYNLTLLSFMLLSMMMLDSIYRVIIVSILFLLLFYKKTFFYKNLKYIVFISIALFIISGGLNPIIGKLELYLFRDIVQYEGLGLHFYAVMNTIPEVQAINFETMAIRTSGSLIAFMFALLGYVLLLFKYRILIITLPMLALGFLSLFAGLRFTIYAVPIMALSVSYLIYLVSVFLAKKFEGKLSKIVKNYLLIILTFLVLLPNLIHINKYFAYPTVPKQVVQSLDELNKISNINDYTIGWWSYGYLIRYYTETNTLIDGGLHRGSDNFPTSFIFTTTSQDEAVKMANLTISYDKKRIENKELDNPPKDVKSFIEQMTVDNGFKDTNLFLESIQNIQNIKTEPFNEDIYLFLPAKVLTMFSRIIEFSNMDLMTGKKLEKRVYYNSKSYDKKDKKIILDNRVSIDLHNNKVFMSSGIHTINEFITTKYDENKNLQISRQTLNKNGKVNIIFLEEYNMYLVIDNKLIDSVFIKLFVFEDYDKDLFTPVFLDPMSKIYKLRKY